MSFSSLSGIFCRACSSSDPSTDTVKVVLDKVSHGGDSGQDNGAPRSTGTGLELHHEEDIKSPNLPAAVAVLDEDQHGSAESLDKEHHDCDGVEKVGVEIECKRLISEEHQGSEQHERPQQIDEDGPQEMHSQQSATAVTWEHDQHETTEALDNEVCELGGGGIGGVHAEIQEHQINGENASRVQQEELERHEVQETSEAVQAHEMQDTIAFEHINREIAQADAERVLQFLSANKFKSVSDVKTNWRRSSSPLHSAVRLNDSELIRCLIAAKANHTVKVSGCTPLELAQKLAHRDKHLSFSAVISELQARQ